MRPTTRPVPLPGEGFDGYLERVSTALDAPLGFVLDAVGLPRGYRAGWGVYLTPELTADVADALDLDPAAIRAMTIARYAHAIPPPEPFEPLTMGIWAATQWVHLGGSPYCPQHLAESGGWLLAHRIAVGIGCTEHSVALIDQCPGCAQWPHGGRHTSGQPLFTDRPRIPGRCHRPDRTPSVRSGRASMPCLADLCAVPARALDPIEHDWQSNVDQVLAGESIELAGIAIPPERGLRALREVLALQNRLGVTRHGRTRTGRFWRSPPRDLTRTRTLIRDCATWTRHRDTPSAAAAFLDAATAAGAPVTDAMIRQGLASSRAPALEALVIEVLRQTGRPSARLNRRRGSQCIQPRPDLPQLAWPCAIPPQLHESRRPALAVLRAYASLALVRMNAPTWASAGRILGIGEHTAVRISRYVHGTLSAADRDALAARLHHVAEALVGVTLPRTWPTESLPRHRLPALTSARCGDPNRWCPCAGARPPLRPAPVTGRSPRPASRSGRLG